MPGKGTAISEPIVDYILRITREIWEDRNPDLVMRYYGPQARIHALGGIMRGAAEVTENTRAMQAAFPDRLVIGEDVVCSPLEGGAWLSSHRIRSPMTSRGDNAYGPATGRKVTTHVIADCVVKNGLIEKEWLVRDNLSLVRQLGLDPLEVARREAARSHPDEHVRWLADERKRVLNAPPPAARIPLHHRTRSGIRSAIAREFFSASGSAPPSFAKPLTHRTRY